MATEGLPLHRQERGADSDILAGADFLSVFISSSLRRAYGEATTTTLEPTTIPTTWRIAHDEGNSYTRATRSTSLLTSSPVAQTSPEDNSFYDTTVSAQLDKLDKQSSDSSSNDGVIIAVSVSSSVGRTLINKEQHEPEVEIENTTLTESDLGTTTEYLDQNIVASEEHPSIVAEVNKSEFSVEESEPITTNRDLTLDFNKGYPARVQQISAHSLYNPSTDFVAEQLAQNSGKDKLESIQQTVIYHNNPREPGRARSVSYSTLAQAVPQNEKIWHGSTHERHERHYDGTQDSFNNNFEHNSEKGNINETKAIESKDQLITTNPKSEINWEKPEENFTPPTTTRKNTATTERNWEVQEKPYSPPPQLPTIYGRPEQNYEIDESASVMTNGRVHGVQPSPTSPSKQETKIEESKKIDDNQKVGYVVEGRNYRRYRVEERTSDGFIVGEYGVVSHDDGSLRGVRYTADGTINPRLIYDALMKFLSL